MNYLEKLSPKDRNTLIFVSGFLKVLKERGEDPTQVFDAVMFLMNPEVRIETKAKLPENPTEDECEEALFRAFDVYFDSVERSHPKTDFMNLLGKLEKVCQAIDRDIPLITFTDFLSLLHFILDDMNKDYIKNFPNETVLSAWPILEGDLEDPWSEVRESKEQTNGVRKESH